jgi:hypothetical protein
VFTVAACSWKGEAGEELSGITGQRVSLVLADVFIGVVIVVP